MSKSKEKVNIADLPAETFIKMQRAKHWNKDDVMEHLDSADEFVRSDNSNRSKDKLYMLLDDNYNSMIAVSNSPDKVYKMANDLADRYVYDKDQKMFYHDVDDGFSDRSNEFYSGQKNLEHTWRIDEISAKDIYINQSNQIDFKDSGFWSHPYDKGKTKGKITVSSHVDLSSELIYQYRPEKFQPDFVRAVKQEDFFSEIKKDDNILCPTDYEKDTKDLYREYEPFRLDDYKPKNNLNELAKEGRKTAQKDEKPQKDDTIANGKENDLDLEDLIKKGWKRAERTVYQLNDGEDMDSPVKCSFSAGEIYDAICDASEDYTQDFDAIEEDLDYDPYDAEYKSAHEWNIYAYPESMIDEIDEDGIAWLKDDQNVDYEKAHCGRIFVETQFTEESLESEKSLYLDTPDLDMQRAYSGTVAVEAQCDDDDRIEDVSMQERFSTEFVKAVKKERPESDIQKFREISISPDGETVDYSLNDIAKKGFLMADQQLEQPQKSQNRTAQAER